MACMLPSVTTAPESRAQWFRWAANYVNLSTPAGLLVATLGRASIRRGPRGLWLAEHYRLAFPMAGAFTIGNVLVTASDWDELTGRFPDLLQHEEAHSWQYVYCLGLPYLLPYCVCMGWSKLLTGDRAAANFFERQAGLTEGGYVDLPYSTVRSIPSRLADRLRCRVERSRRRRLTRSGS